MEIFRSCLFDKYDEIIFGISPKFGFDREAPFYFNMSLTVGDNEKIVWENREYFCNSLGLIKEQVAFQRQVHSDIVTIVDKGGFAGESDALITNKPMTGLAISTADCTPIFIYDKNKKVIAGVHSGWRGTEKRILGKTVSILIDKFGCLPSGLLVFIGPSISCENYEVGEEVASKFHNKYSTKKENGKYLLDVKKVNYDLLLEAGVPEENIELSDVCSYGNDNLHSYRRDKEVSGRALGIIAMRGV